MIQLIVGVVVGLFAGGLGGYSWAALRSGGSRERTRALQVRVKDLEAALERERREHEAAVGALSDRFKVLADEAMRGVLGEFRDNQEVLFAQRQSALDERLGPLDTLLRDYQARVRELEEAGQRGLLDVKHSAEALLEAQGKVMDETRRLNTILGRSSHRGRWGEIQLERILEYSDMLKHVDFEPQMTVKGELDNRQRPDVVVRLPRGASIAIDAKVPYEAFDRAMAADNDAEREQALAQYAAALRAHVGELRKRRYFDSLAVSPSFVVCFVPSDFLLSAAFEADPSLLENALESNVLVAGPTTLMGLLWSAHLGWSQFESMENIEEIKRLAERLVERTGTLYNHLTSLGSSLERSTKAYNSLVGSLEGQLLVTVREIQSHGVKTARTIVDAEAVDEVARHLDERRWPSGASQFAVLDVTDAELAGELGAADPVHGAGEHAAVVE